MEKALQQKSETKPLKNYVAVDPKAKKATRASFGDAMVEIGKSNPNVVVLDADLSCSTKSEKFANAYPERFYQMGIAESNMIGTAAGLALSGKTPFLFSFGCFVAGRFETIRISIAYNQVNCRIVGTHAGLGIGEDGYTQMALEDIACMRSLPAMGVLQPADDVETRKMVAFLSENHKGPVYIRLTRQGVPKLFNENYTFEYGKGVRLKEGKDAVILATGGLVYNAYAAAEKLDKQGVSTAVYNIHTIKPLDQKLVLELAQSYKWMVTVEDHNIIGGLGGAVAEVLANTPKHAPLTRIGVNDIYGESGTEETLYEKYGLSAQKIFERLAKTFQQ